MESLGVISTEGKKAVVSGANGFIGSAVVKELLKQDYQVTALDREENYGNLPDDNRIIFIPFDLAHMESLLEKITVQDYAAFYHFAWAGSAGEARADISLQLDNAKWTADALHIAKKIGCRRFVCAGSIMEQEAAAAIGLQGGRPGAGNIYGAGKLAAHIMCKTAAASIGMDLVWAQITNAYGPGEYSPRLINTTIRKCIKRETPIFTSGTQNYDFVYIDDAARAFRLIAENGKPFHEYMIGSSNARTLKEFLTEMKAAIAPDLEFVFGEMPFQGAELSLEVFSCEKTAQDTGFRAEVSFAEGTKKTMDWIKSVEDGNGAEI